MMKIGYQKLTILSSRIALLLLFLIVLTSCSHSQNNISATKSNEPPILGEFKLTSPAFKSGDAIPSLYTCDSLNVSPPLQWNKPAGSVQSYALIMDDPDAPLATWVHWVVYKIPATYLSLPFNFQYDTVFKNGIKQGITSFGSHGYGGPCPPEGMHHYHFKIYALDTILNLPAATTGKKGLIASMKGHIIAEAELLGTYERRLKIKK